MNDPDYSDKLMKKLIIVLKKIKLKNKILSNIPEKKN